MGKIWYLSPSCQASNIGVDGYGSEMEQMYLLTYEITPHLDRAGVSFSVPERTVSITRRARESNEMGAKFHLALHSNASDNGSACGPVALYYSDAGKEFGEKLIAALLALGQKTNRSSHIEQRIDLYELRKTTAPALLLEVDFHDSPTGVEFITSRRSDIAEAIARVIIEADGKQFVPETDGGKRDKAVLLGLFSADSDWASPLSKEEAAALAVDILSVAERG